MCLFRYDIKIVISDSMCTKFVVVPCSLLHALLIA